MRHHIAVLARLLNEPGALFSVDENQSEYIEQLQAHELRTDSGFMFTPPEPFLNRRFCPFPPS